MNSTTQTNAGISNLRAFLIAVTIVACGGSLSVAACAWINHFWWMWTGAYHHNSFPMGAFAKEASGYALCICLASGLIWGVALLWERRGRA
jgi:hypothetical protein